MNDSPTTTTTPPSWGRSHRFTLGLIAVLVAAAAGVYLYVRAQNTEPPPVDEFADLKPFFAELKRGTTLADQYADADKDLVADPPADPAKFQKVAEIGFTVVGTADEDRLKAEQEEWKDLMAALGKATGKPVKYRTDVPGPDAQGAALRDGRLQVTAFNTGAVPTAVNTAGFVPLFAPADAAGSFAYQMQILVKPDGPVRTPEDLRGKTVGFVALSSNSGAKAPMFSLKDKFGMLPGRDYQFKFTGDHRASIAELVYGTEYDAVCVASDLKDQTLAEGKVRFRGEKEKRDVRPDQVRAVFTSDSFPPLCFGVPHDLPKDVRAAVEKAFREYRFEGTSAARNARQGKAKFAPVNYAADWQYVRAIDHALVRFADLP